ncbi:MAG: hypothetical protein MJE63_15985 [Proteobacteria bacterium]|nr:hypothetical protein [Pseudomonadota bacterium]
MTGDNYFEKTLVHSIPSLERQYQAVREGIAFNDLSDVRLYEVTGDETIDYLDFVLTGPVGRLREENLLHTLCIDLEGNIISDIYVVNVDGERGFLMADGGDLETLDQFLKTHLANFEEVKLNEINSSYSLFSLDGPYSTIPFETVCGPEILGLRYMSFLTLEEDENTFVLRAGKTGEYGFWVLTPRENSQSLTEKLWHEAEKSGHPIASYGEQTKELVRMENNFLNIEAEGRFTRNPLELGLFWAFQIDKEMVAEEAVENMLNSKIEKSLVGFIVESGEVQEGDRVFYKENEIGVIVAIQHSFALDKQIGKALLNPEYNYTGMIYKTAREPVLLKTVSMPFVFNKSLTVKNS